MMAPNLLVISSREIEALATFHTAKGLQTHRSHKEVGQSPFAGDANFFGMASRTLHGNLCHVIFCYLDINLKS